MVAIFVTGLKERIILQLIRIILTKASNNVGYLYDYYRQHDKAKREEIEKSIKLKKKINKLSKKNKYIKPKK